MKALLPLVLVAPLLSGCAAVELATFSVQLATVPAQLATVPVLLMARSPRTRASDDEMQRRALARARRRQLQAERETARKRREQEEDSQEPNNTRADATPVSRGLRYNSLRAFDNDWYRVDLVADEQLDVTIRFDPHVDRLDLALKDADNNVLASGEHARYRATETGPIYIRVRPAFRVGAEYVLEVR